MASKSDKSIEVEVLRDHLHGRAAVVTGTKMNLGIREFKQKRARGLVKSIQGSTPPQAKAPAERTKSGLSDLSVDELRALAEKEGKVPEEGSGADGNVVKADLVAALVEADGDEGAGE